MTRSGKILPKPFGRIEMGSKLASSIDFTRILFDSTLKYRENENEIGYFFQNSFKSIVNYFPCLMSIKKEFF